MIVNDLGTMSYLNNTNEPGQGGSNMLLMLVVLFGGLALWQMLTPPPEAPASTAGAVEEVAPVPTAPAAPSDSTDAAPSASQPAAEARQPYRLTSVFEDAEVQFYVSNIGGRVAGIHILQPEQYQFEQGEHDLYPTVLECTNGVCKDQGNAVLNAQLPLSLRIEALDTLTETSVWAVDDEASACQIRGDAVDCTKLVMRWSTPDGSIALTRTFAPASAEDGPFGLISDLTIRNNSSERRLLGNVTTTLYGNWSVPSGGMLNQTSSPTEVACFADGKFRDRAAKKLEEPREYANNVQYVAINGRYFMAAIAPRGAAGESATEERCVMKFAPRSAEDTVALELSSSVTLEPNSEITRSHAYVAAPKRIEALKIWDQELNQTVRFGMFAFLAVFIRWLLVFFYSLVQNWGLAIVLLTIAIKALLLPVTAKSFQSMEKMKLISPKLEELKKKHENDQQKLAQEQMKLFKDEGVNPLSGCLPMLLQMPIYFALYRTIYSSSELYQAPFMGWISDLTQRDPYFVLPVLVSLLMLAQVKFMPQAANTNPQMKMMQWMMPIMFIPVTLFLPAGLVLYIFVNIILSIVQQAYVRKRLERATADAVVKA